MIRRSLSFFMLCTSCASSSAGPLSSLVDVDASVPDADVAETSVPSGDAGTVGASVDKAAMCASTFGKVLTNAFGRVDGEVVAVVPPAHPTCAQPNRSHLVLQVKIQGDVYRMVVNVESTSANPNVWNASLPHALPMPAWQEGWHPGVTLDYVTDLGLTKSMLAETETMTLTKKVYDALMLGDKVSVYATSTGGTKADSAHLVHRNGGGSDGALVLNAASTSPVFVVFAFEEQAF